MLMDIHSHIYLLINDTAHTIALYSTVKCNGVTMYNLSVGICAIVPWKTKKNIICLLTESYKNENIFVWFDEKTNNIYIFFRAFSDMPTDKW